MAKQVLDLYMLYKLVTEKGGLVEVINKKIWREITKGLNLPTSITSAAFTLRTQWVQAQMMTSDRWYLHSHCSPNTMLWLKFSPFFSLNLIPCVQAGEKHSHHIHSLSLPIPAVFTVIIVFYMAWQLIHWSPSVVRLLCVCMGFLTSQSHLLTVRWKTLLVIIII